VKVDKVGTNYNFDKPILFRRDNIARKINEIYGGDYGRTSDKVAMYSVSRAMIRMDGGSAYVMTLAAATTVMAIACRNGERINRNHIGVEKGNKCENNSEQLVIVGNNMI
jgi:hypothetical protein